jgi:hypothetical protein
MGSIYLTNVLLLAQLISTFNIFEIAPPELDMGNGR